MGSFSDAVFCTHRNRIANASHHADVFRGQIMNWKNFKSFLNNSFNKVQKFNQPSMQCSWRQSILIKVYVYVLVNGNTVNELWFMNV